MNEKTQLQRVLSLKGLTRKQAAEVCNVSVSTLTAHCLGHRDMSLKAAANYAHKLNVPLDWLALPFNSVEFPEGSSNAASA